MTKQNFIALADMLRNSRPVSLSMSQIVDPIALGRLQEWEIMRDKLADFCAAQNPAFNRARWLAYIARESGPSGGKVKKVSPETMRANLRQIGDALLNSRRA